MNGWQRFWNGFAKLHLYCSKPEALFKISILIITWVCSVRVAVPLESVPKEIYNAYFLFAIALLMEYSVSLITASSILSKIFPLIVCGVGWGVAVVSLAAIFERPFVNVQYTHIEGAILIAMAVLVFDLLSMIVIDSPKNMTESNLKNI